MRLTPTQHSAIRETAEEIFGPGVAIWLFGSRVDAQRRGGDIDLLIRPDPPTADSPTGVSLSARFVARLLCRIGEQRVDLVIKEPGDERPIVELAHRTGVRL